MHPLRRIISGSANGLDYSSRVQAECMLQLTVETEKLGAPPPASHRHIPKLADLYVQAPTILHCDPFPRVGVREVE